MLTWLRDLFGLSLIEKNLSWYLMNGRLSMQRARTVGEYINRLLIKIRPHALDLVDAFGYGPDHLRAAIATGAEKLRQDEARDFYRAQRASGQAPVDEKVLLARKARSPPRRSLRFHSSDLAKARRRRSHPRGAPPSGVRRLRLLAAATEAPSGRRQGWSR